MIKLYVFQLHNAFALINPFSDGNKCEQNGQYPSPIFDNAQEPANDTYTSGRGLVDVGLVDVCTAGGRRAGGRETRNVGLMGM